MILRETLTALAIVLILLLTTALVGPWLVDWNGQRASVEARLSQVLGADVKVSGAIDLKLLPTPYLALDGVSAQSAGLDFKASGARLEIALTSLLRGDLHFTDAQFSDAKLNLNLADVMARPMSLPLDARFEKIQLRRFALGLRDGAGRMVQVQNITLDAEARSLLGPFRAEGSFDAGDARRSFRFSTAAIEEGRARLKLIVDVAPKQRAEFEGALSSAGFQGQASLSGEQPVAWKAFGTLRADFAGAVVDALQFSAGPDEAQVQAEGKAELIFGAQPQAHVSLQAKQIEREKLPPMTVIAEHLRSAGQGFSMPVTLDLGADVVPWGGQIVSDAKAQLRLMPGQKPALQFSGALPGQARTMLDGQFVDGRFEGRATLAASDTPRLSQWLTVLMPEAGLSLHDMALRRAEFAGQIGLTADGFEARNFKLSLERSQFSGHLSYRAAQGKERARLNADLSADVLDIDGAPDLSGFGAGGLDGDVKLNARTFKLARVGQAMVAAGRLSAHVTREGETLHLRSLTLADVGGANLDSSGRADARGARLDVALDAAKLEDAGTLLSRIWPGIWSDGLAARARLLSPARLQMSVEALRTAGSLVPQRFKLAGSVAGTQIAGEMTPQNHEVQGQLRLDAPEAGALVRQLDLPVLPLNGFGRGVLSLRLRGAMDQPLQADLDGELAGTRLRFRGQADLSQGQGRLSIATPDLTPVLVISALMPGDMTARLPAEMAGDVSWSPKGIFVQSLSGSVNGAAVSGQLAFADKRLTGALQVPALSLGTLSAFVLGPPQPVKAGALWPTLAFAPATADPPQMHVDMSVGSLEIWPGLTGRDARFALELAPGRIGLNALSMVVSNAKATGAMALRRDGDAAVLNGRVGLENLAVELPSLKGLATGQLEFSSTGTSTAALVGGLAGQGQLQMGNLIVRQADPGAISRVFLSVEQERVALDGAKISQALAVELARGDDVIGDVPLKLVLAGGVVQAAAMPRTAGGLSKLAFDLQNFMLDQQLSFGADAPNAEASALPLVTLAVKGPAQSPTRSIDATSLINLLSTRALEREAARIAAFEADVRERAFFNRRQKSERMREEERQRVLAARLRAQQEEEKKALDALVRSRAVAPQFQAPASGADPSAAGRY